ncbi:Acetate kinase [Planctomycetes bacterium Pan216]|uniref:Acetate kinase n=1 Tax=Kolteria novifilia TaxID=2527975 RepID=A0A518B9S6_9BACT|nr:Acetate kinase [Planctomycetes bacterium Pan216]
MKILVSNIGSTSFKYRLYAMPEETLLARGGVERIGAENSRSYVIRDGETTEKVAPVPDHGEALSACFGQLTDPETGCLKEAGEIAAIGFKSVHAKGVSGVQLVDEKVLEAMEAFAKVAPAHNPPYVKAMRQLKSAYPELPLVAAFETGFHQTVPRANRTYAIPYEWMTDLGVERWGFHGASHRYIAGRIAELTGGKAKRVISCHLGGSSSICAIENGKSVGASMGMSPQSGLPNNNRVGDLDVFALPAILEGTDKSLEEVLDVLANQSGLLGISGVGNDLREIEEAAAGGNERATLAIDVFVESIRDYLGSYLVRLGGLDALVFTGGIGENSSVIRERVCRGLDGFGIVLDASTNESFKGEGRLSPELSATEVWVVPTNEEIIVARQSYERLTAKD